MKPFIPQTLPLKDIDWAILVPLIGSANASLARYDGMLQSIVNPDVILSPLTTEEAVLSSRIEGTQISIEEVMEFEADPNERIEPSKYSDIKEIVNYRFAIDAAIEKLKKRPLCLNLFKELHKILLDSVRGKNKAPGEFRRVQNFVGPPGCSIEEATFVPPSPELIGPALDNWEKYLHYDEKDKLVQLAVAKAQFEIIHPFLDGNGRIGRMLIPVFLFEKGLLSSPMFYLSAYLEKERDVYYQRLQDISKTGAWNRWISFFLTAIIEQAESNIKKVNLILDLYEKMKKEVPRITHSQYAIQAIDTMFSRPIFKSTDFIKRSGIPKGTAIRILNTLRKEEIILDLRPKKGSRGATMVFFELMKLNTISD